MFSVQLLPRGKKKRERETLMQMPASRLSFWHLCDGARARARSPEFASARAPNRSLRLSFPHSSSSLILSSAALFYAPPAGGARLARLSLSLLFFGFMRAYIIIIAEPARPSLSSRCEGFVYDSSRIMRLARRSIFFFFSGILMRNRYGVAAITGRSWEMMFFSRFLCGRGVMKVVELGLLFIVTYS